MNETLPNDLADILTGTPELKRAFLVGGCVRDWLLGEPQKDYDIEVFGLDYETMANALARWGRVDLVGRSFGVIKLTTKARNTYDFSIPRRDSKSGIGHKGFAVTFDPDLKIEEAAARRDFTINDSKTDLGSRVDRHAGIGQGKIGKEAFRHIVNDQRFANHPGCLETPKSKDLHEDVENLAILRGLCSVTKTKVARAAKAVTKKIKSVRSRSGRV